METRHGTGDRFRTIGRRDAGLSAAGAEFRDTG